MTDRIPLYLSIMEIIKECIINGIYPIGTLLPTETEFEKQFNVSKITIRKAIELLENDGYLSRKSGKGTTVTSNSLFNKLSKGDSFSNILNKQGAKFSKEKTIFELVHLDPQDKLSQYFGQHCIKITRLYYLDAQPYIYMAHFIPEDTGLETITNHNNFSIYMHLYKHNYQVKKFNDEFYVDYPTLAIQEELQIGAHPVLSRKRTTYDHQDKIIEISYAQYNTRLHHYQINYQI